jgi:hypothetical protein
MLDHSQTPGSAGRPDHGYSHDACQLYQAPLTWSSSALSFGYLMALTFCSCVWIRSLISWARSVALLQQNWDITSTIISAYHSYPITEAPLLPTKALKIDPSLRIMCDYTQVQYKCSHLRYVVRAWCTKYQETHKRCPANVVAM